MSSLTDATGFCAYDTCCNGRSETERITHSKNPFAHLYGIRVAKDDRGEVVSLDFEQCEVGSGVATDNLCIESAVVIECHFHFLSTVDNMVICYDIAVGSDNYTRSESKLLRL